MWENVSNYYTRLDPGLEPGFGGDCESPGWLRGLRGLPMSDRGAYTQGLGPLGMPLSLRGAVFFLVFFLGRSLSGAALAGAG